MRHLSTLLAYLSLAVFTATAEPFNAKVIGVSDGDTITILDTRDTRPQSVTVRLQGIDAPEGKQDYGKRSKAALSGLVFGQVVTIHDQGPDRYGRTIADVHAGETWVNQSMVRDGWAWHYKKHSTDSRLAKAEEIARESRAGLWADQNEPVPPWEYRVMQKAKTAPSGPRWLNTSSNMRHNSGCKYFENTKRGRLSDSDEGRACGMCGG
jgi:endonuclease YncB( thermonuclease family)